MHEAIGWNGCAIAIEHIVKEHAEIWLTDIHCPLHSLGSQADLVALDGTAILLLERNPGVLDRIGIVNSHFRIVKRELPAGSACPLSLLQAQRGFLQLIRGHA